MRIKGIALPVNSVIVIALAVMVLMMLAAFFMFGFDTTPTNVERGWTNGCGTLKSAHNCDAEKVSSIDTGEDVTGDGVSDNLLEVCRQKFTYADANEYFCRNKCCSTTAVEGMACSINEDCQSGLGRRNWECNSAVDGTPNPACCPSGKGWNETSNQCE